MKKYIISILILLLTFTVKGQFNNQTGVGNAFTETYDNGARGTATGIHFRYSFSDTTAANVGSVAGVLIKNIANFLIVVGDDMWKRNNAATLWIKQTGSSSSGTVSSVGLTVTTPSSPAFSVSNTPITTSGNIALNLLGTANQVVLGNGALGSSLPSALIPTWQQTLTAGSTLTGNNTIAGGGFDFTFGNIDNFGINTIGSFGSTATSGGETTSISNNSSNIVLQASSSAGNSFIRVYHDTVKIEPHLGNFIIDTLNNETSQNTLIGWTSTSGANRGKVGYITFTANDFDLATGNFSIDYTNGQAASTSAKGFLTAADWNTFNGKGAGTVTSVGFTGGLISVANPTTTPAFTVAGTSGGIPYFSSTSTWASSSLLAANALMIGGGAGTAPSTTTTGTGILTWLGTPSSANLISAVTDETGSGVLVFGTSPTFTTSIFAPIVYGGTGSAGDLQLYSTSHGTKGKILFGSTGAYVETTNRLGLGTQSPSADIHVADADIANAWFIGANYSQMVFGIGVGGSQYAEFYRPAAGTFSIENTGKDITLSNGSGTYSGADGLVIKYSTTNVGIGVAAPNASAKLEVSSTTQGFLPPRMTATQASAITPVDGLLLYVTSTNGTFTAIGFWGYVAGVWTQL